MIITTTMLVFLTITLVCGAIVMRAALSIKNGISEEEVFYLIEKHGHKGYVSIEKLRQMEKTVIEEDTPEEIAEREAFYKERDEKRAAEKKALGFVETECPMCECKFLTRRVNDKHMVEE